MTCAEQRALRHSGMVPFHLHRELFTRVFWKLRYSNTYKQHVLLEY